MRLATAAALAALAGNAYIYSDQGSIQRVIAPLELPAPSIPSLVPAPPPETLAAPVSLPRGEALRIGKLIWRNEAGGKVTLLTHWNEGEAFASLGIGHFIWYPAGARGPFVESFPPMLAFLAASGVRVPSWARGACPWPDRASFYKDFRSRRMRRLRSLLAATVSLQAEFAAQRLEQALPKILEAAAPGERANLRGQFERLAQTPGGFYPLVDYVNFKGEGTAAAERYQGEGWGLLQVLEGMSGASPGQAALDEFADSARRVLTRRVLLSPPERRESRWLEGWLSRVETYRRPLG